MDIIGIIFMYFIFVFMVKLNAKLGFTMRAYGFKRHYEYEKFHKEDIVIRLMYMYKELTGCEEFSRNYPNREFWESLYGNYEDAEDED